MAEATETDLESAYPMGPESQPTPDPEWGEHCPDCGCDPKDDTLHRDGCRRIFEKGDPREELQFGPPWLPWRDA